MLMTLVHTSNSLLYTYTHVKSIRQEEYEERAQKKHTTHSRADDRGLLLHFYAEKQMNDSLFSQFFFH